MYNRQHKWLTESNITRAELEKFDKLKEVSSNSVIDRRRKMKTEFDPDALDPKFLKKYKKLSKEFRKKFRKTVKFLEERYTNPDRVPVKRPRSPVSSPKRRNPGAELDNYEDAPSLEEVPGDSLEIGRDELTPIEIIDVTEAADARIIQGWYRRKTTTLKPDAHVPRNRDLLPTPGMLELPRLSPLRRLPPLSVRGTQKETQKEQRPIRPPRLPPLRGPRLPRPGPVPPRAKVVLRF